MAVLFAMQFALCMMACACVAIGSLFFYTKIIYETSLLGRYGLRPILSFPEHCDKLWQIMYT